MDEQIQDLQTKNDDLQTTVQYLTDLFSSDTEKNKNTKPQMLMKISALEQINNDLYAQLDKELMKKKYDRIGKRNEELQSELQKLQRINYQ